MIKMFFSLFIVGPLVLLPALLGFRIYETTGNVLVSLAVPAVIYLGVPVGIYFVLSAVGKFLDWLGKSCWIIWVGGLLALLVWASLGSSIAKGGNAADWLVWFSILPLLMAIVAVIAVAVRKPQLRTEKYELAKRKWFYGTRLWIEETMRNAPTTLSLSSSTSSTKIEAEFHRIRNELKRCQTPEASAELDRLRSDWLHLIHTTVELKPLRGHRPLSLRSYCSRRE